MFLHHTLLQFSHVGARLCAQIAPRLAQKTFKILQNNKFKTGSKLNRTFSFLIPGNGHKTKVIKRTLINLLVEPLFCQE